MLTAASIVSIKDQEFNLTMDSFKNIDIDWIEALKIFKDVKETAKYGPKGVNGVILITIKKVNQSDAMGAMKKPDFIDH